jgi:hypothetical protein
MGHCNDVVSGTCLGQPVDRPAHPLRNRQETLAARRRLMRRRVPEAMEVAVALLAQLLIGQALPPAKILLGKIGERQRIRAGDRPRPG